MTEREIFTMEQGSESWFQVRLTIVTSSHFSDVLNTGSGRATYMWVKIVEKQQNRCKPTYQSAAMKNGVENEQHARKFYEDKYHNGKPMEQIGFIRWGQIGCSPDGLVDDDGIIEIKCSEGRSHYELMLKNESRFEKKVPTTHIPQIQGNLWITDRKWCDYISYDVWGLNAPFSCIRVDRDNAYIDNILAPACEIFIQEMNDINQKILKIKC